MNLNSKQKFLELSKRYSALIIIIFLVVLFAALNPRFLSAVNITNIVRHYDHRCMRSYIHHDCWRC